MPWNGWVRERGEERENILPNMPLYFYVIFAEWEENYIKIKKIKKRKRKKKKKKKMKAQTRLRFPPPFYTKEPTLTKLAYLRVSFFFFFLSS